MIGATIIAIFATSAHQSGQATQLPIEQLRSPQSIIAELYSKDPYMLADAKEHEFVNSVLGYIHDSPKLKNEIAAQKWLDLIDVMNAVPARPMRGAFGGSMPQPIASFATVFAALPEPRVWPTIERIVGSMPESTSSAALRMLFARLRGDDGALTHELDRIEAADAAKPEGQRGYDSFVGDMRQSVLARSHNLTAQIVAFEREIKSKDRGRTPPLPDIATRMPAGDAEKVLLRILKETKQPLYLTGAATVSLAKQVAVGHIAEITRPPWWLVSRWDDSPFEMALLRRYGESSLQSGDENSTAQTLYFARLLGDGRIKECAQFVGKFERLPSLDISSEPQTSRRQTAHLFDAIGALQAIAPPRHAAAMWGLYVSAAKLSGHAKLAANRVQSIAHNPKTPIKTRLELFPQLWDLHAFMGDKAAVARDLIDYGELPRTKDDADARDYSFFNVARLLGNPSLLKVATALQVKSGSALRDEDFLRSLHLEERYAELESMILEGLAHESNLMYAGPEYGERLADIYDAANRPRDVLKLLAEYPYWSTTSLGEVIAARRLALGQYPGRRPSDLPLVAARAAAANGNRILAIQIVKEILTADDSCDAAYRMLNTLEGAAANSTYYALIQANPMHMRPLIWKGKLALDTGNLPEAERLLRAAIALDPMDTSGAIGERQVGYGVLGTILARRGQAKESTASFCRMRSAKLLVLAEQYRLAGLIPQFSELTSAAVQLAPTDSTALKAYAESLDQLGRFSEADVLNQRYLLALPLNIGPATDLEYFEDANNPYFQQIYRSTPSMFASRSNAAYANVRGLFAIRMGRLQTAGIKFREALGHEPNSVIALSGIQSLGGDGFTSVGDGESASISLLSLAPPKSSSSTFDFGMSSDLRPLSMRIAALLKSKAPPKFQPLMPLHSLISTDIEDGPSRDFRSKVGETLGILLWWTRDLMAIGSRIGEIKMGFGR